MAQWKDEQPGTDDADFEGDDDFDRMRDMLYARVSEFAEEHDLPVGALSPLLLDLGVSSRMMDYVLSVEKPSASGLKLDLDRMRRDVDDLVRSCKRNAEEFIDHSKDALREAQAELEAEMEAEGGLESEDQEKSRKP
jgi:hypothetical protein